MKFEVGKYYRHITRDTRVHVLGYLPRAIFNCNVEKNRQILIGETINGVVRRLYQGNLTKWDEDPPWSIINNKVYPTIISESNDTTIQES